MSLIITFLLQTNLKYYRKERDSQDFRLLLPPSVLTVNCTFKQLKKKNSSPSVSYDSSHFGGFIMFPAIIYNDKTVQPSMKYKNTNNEQ